MRTHIHLYVNETGSNYLYIPTKGNGYVLRNGTVYLTDYVAIVSQYSV